MADAQSNIKVSIDTAEALANIKNLQRQISAFHTSMSKGGAAANAVTAQMQQGLINSINATGKFSAQMKTIRTTTESFTNSLEKNKFSLGEYFRYAGGASKTFGRLFKSEFDTINKVARENVKDLQTQYIKMGRDANGAMKAIAVRPLSLDMNDLATKTMIASEKQALLNQLLKQGSTNLLNFGKNTQWAGRQLMVGFTLPLVSLGAAASKTFMDMEAQAIRFKKVYGDLFTPQEESVRALKNIQDLGKEFTKYGIAVSTTVGLAAEAAAAGFQGLDLQRQTEAATKLSILGQVDSQKALETTIALQNAFSMSSENLAESIDFLNAVENQTVLSLDDVSTAIPKAAPIVQQLGGDVKDLAFFMTAMKEGGINASEGANALKSGLASLINPTGKAAAMLEGFGINAKKIVVDNKGDLKKTVIEFATALNQLDPLNRAQAIEQMFGKFQFSRLSTLFANVTKEGTQAARVLDLAGSSVQELAALSEKELGMTSESAMNKFKASVENLKLALVPVGEEFLKAVTPIAQFVTRILEGFNNLGDGTKKIIVTLTAIVAGLGPVLLMTFGLLANGIANIIKGFTAMKTLFNRTGQSSATLGTEVRYMTLEQRNAAAVAASLDQVHRNLAQTFTAEAASVDRLTAAYARSIAAQKGFMPTGVPMARGPIPKRAKGKPAVVGGTGNQDSELAFLMPGETVIPTKMSEKYGALINGMIADNIPGYSGGRGTRASRPKKSIGERTQDVPVFGDLAIFAQDSVENQSQSATAPALEQVLAPLVTRVAEARGLGFSQQTQAEHYPGIIEEYTPTVQTFVDNLSDEMNRTVGAVDQETGKIQGSSERLARAWQVAGRSVEAELAAIPNEVERGRVRQALGLDPDSYGSVAGDFRGSHGWGGRTGRYADDRSPISFADKRVKSGTRAAFKMISGRDMPAKTDMGHVFDQKTREKLGLPTTVPLADLRADTATKPSVISGIDNSIRREEEKAARNRTVGQATETTEEAVTAVKRTARTQSPSKRTIPVGEDIARGLSAGIKKETPKVVAEASKMTDAAINGTRTRRRSSRPQGAPVQKAVPGKRVRRGAASAGGTVGPDGRITSAPAFINTPENAKMLPIVSKPEPMTRTQRLMAGAKRMPRRMNSLSGGMGLLGANMGLGMLPDFAGKGAAQGALAGANLGMMFGPKGMAAGAAIGLVTSAYTTLIAKQKEHAEITKSVFTSSARDIEFFGGKVIDTTLKMNGLGFSIKGITTSFGAITPEVQAFVDAIKELPEDDPTRLFVEGLKKLETTSAVTGNIRAKVSEAISLGGLPVEDAQKYVAALLEASGRSSEFAEVWKSVQKSLSNETEATTAMFNKLNDTLNTTNSEIVGNSNSWYEYDRFSRVVLKTYDQMNTEQRLVADSLKRFTGAMTNGSLTADQFNARLNGIKNSSFNGVLGLQALRAAIVETGDANALAGFDAINFQLDQIGAKSVDAMIKLMALKNLNITPEGAAKILGKKYNANLPSHIKEKVDAQLLLDASGTKQVEKLMNEAAKLRAAAMGGTTLPYRDPDTGSGGKGKDKLTIEELYLKVLQKEIDKLKAKRDAQKDANDEVQRQIDLQMKMQDLSNQAVQAKISGNYIQAAMLGQESQNVQMKFNQETELRKKDAEIDALQARYNAIKDGAKLTSAEKKKVPKKANGGLIKGPGTGRSDSIRATLGYAGGGSIRVSNGEFVVKASSVQDYGVAAMNAINNGTADISTNSGGTVYNINMPITSNNASPEGVANEVMRRLKVEINKNNKSNKVSI